MKLVIGAFALVLSTQAWAWGEVGHDLISRVAVRLQKDRGNLELYNAMLPKEAMLGHLGNVPDIFWRSGSEDVKKANDPTHFIDLEYLMDGATFHPEKFPSSVKEAGVILQAQCKKPEKDLCPKGGDIKEQMATVGTAPWRVKQLATMMMMRFKELKALQDKKTTDRDVLIAKVDEALFYGGLLSHFIGDLSMPLHVSKDYDGWGRGQGGIHRYFETDLPMIAGLDFDQKVEDAASKSKPFDSKIKPIMSRFKMSANDFFQISLALAYDSFESGKDRLYALDKKLSLQKESFVKDGKRTYAERKPPTETYKVYEPLLIERLSLGADVLAKVWGIAWINGGRPKLDFYHSYTYPVAPDFVWPDYL
jgi:hypothetical protein